MATSFDDIDRFFAQPILNSPYERPAQHWELDTQGQPTHRILEHRRQANFITPIPKPRKKSAAGQQGKAIQGQILFDEGAGLTTAAQAYDPSPLVNQLRHHIDEWRRLPHPSQWQVTPETARLLQHWRSPDFAGVRPFFCQVEAVEAAIWITEVAPNTKSGHVFLEQLANASAEANPGLMRLALKLATGAGKTTVMAMLIAWQTINAVRYPSSRRFTRGFLIVAPGITIKDRLRVLQPSDPDSYYATRNLVPAEMRRDLDKAAIVITNYHAFKLRERLEISRGNRALLKGRGPDLVSTETEGQMIQRVMPELMGMKNVLVINDEAHHCYRTKPDASDLEDLKGDERKEAEANNEVARLWISGLEMVARKLGVARVVDLSATPFFLQGSGYAEGTLFPWTMTDFSLMDAIECGIVKLPRVPVADNIADSDMPMYRKLWDHIGKKMPKKGRGEDLNPLDLPVPLQTALEALYGHYARVFAQWQEAGFAAPPCFIVVCNNTATSKLVYDYISGFKRTNPDGSEGVVNGRLELFRNFDANGAPLARPSTLLIDSTQLESGEGLDDAFKSVAADEIARFRREILERGGKLAEQVRQGAQIDDATLLREVMNTVGRPGTLGGSIRCVVSVSMLTEGWDANTVTHVLGVRAFGTQLLCEQVIGRALRRQSYDLNDAGLFDVEYADVLGIPFDFNAQPVVVKPQAPKQTTQVRAVRPDRDALEITFPRVQGYRVELPDERLEARFNPDSRLELTQALVGATETLNAGIIGQGVDLTLVHTGAVRTNQIVYELASHLVLNYLRDEGGEPKLHVFGQLKRIVREWLEGYLTCSGGTYPAQLLYRPVAALACQRIHDAITSRFIDERPVKAVLDPYNPSGSTRSVNFTTTKTDLWSTDPRLSHVNWAVLDSSWEGEFCRVVESHPRVRAYVKNHQLGFEVPYRLGSEAHRYIPDFIVRIDDGRGDEDLLNLVVEIKGFRGEDAKAKRATMDTYWIPGVNRLGTFGRWDFLELVDQFDIASDFAALIEQAVARSK